MFSTIYKDNIFYLDRRQNIVLCFDIKGNYKYTINAKGRGPGEYLSIHQIYVDPFNEHLMILDSFIGILQYDLSGKFISKIKFPEGVVVNNLTMINKDTILYITSTANDGKRKIMNYVSIKDNKIIGSWYTEDFIYMVNTVFNHYKKATYYCIAKEPYVYDVSQYPPIPAFYWDFGKDNYDYRDLKTPPMENIKQVQKIQLKWIYNTCPWFIYETIERKKYIYTSLSFFEKGDFPNIKAPIYHIFLDKKIETYKVINQFKEGELLRGFPNFTEDAIYTAVEGKGQLESYIDPQYLTPENQEILNNLPEDCNPFILKYTFK